MALNAIPFNYLFNSVKQSAEGVLDTINVRLRLTAKRNLREIGLH